jgi:hypothetical protein
MEFLVQFELDIPDGVAESEVEDRERAEAAAGRDVGGPRSPRPTLESFRRTRPNDGPWSLSRRQQGGTRRTSGRSAAVRMDGYGHHAAPSASERPGGDPSGSLNHSVQRPAAQRRTAPNRSA